MAVPVRNPPRLSLRGLIPCADTTCIEVKYRVPSRASYDDDSVVVNSHLYGAGFQPFSCVHVETGALAWRERFGRRGNACLTYADDRLYLSDSNATVWLIEPSPTKLIVKSSRMESIVNRRGRTDDRTEARSTGRNLLHQFHPGPSRSVNRRTFSRMSASCSWTNLPNVVSHVFRRLRICRKHAVAVIR